MATTAAKRFRAVLEHSEGNLGWIIARLPFDVAEAWTKIVRLRVKVEVGGEVFRTSLFPDAARGGHFLLVNKKMQKAAAAKAGAIIDFTVAPDVEERTAVLPPELARIMKSEKALAKWYTALSSATQWEICKWLAATGSAEARRRRADQMAERLMLTMEGETVLPPVLEVAFRAAPAAWKAWNAMPVTHRRRHLMAVFYYQSPEARQKRVAKVVDEVLNYGRS